jgi:hypothetical protein
MTKQAPYNFYVAGGTLPPSTPSYIERQADQDLFEQCMLGNYCYVLTSRQLGKSSLMARTAQRLKDAGVRTAIVDLTQIGVGQDDENEKGSADKWYNGIARSIARAYNLEANLNDSWRENKDLPALHRLTEFFGDIALNEAAGRIVIFIDEIDSTINLPFADDFFAAIRACYNKRATSPEYICLNFVLLGVASPSDLIKDSTRTPFNIGHRIDLTDFTFAEATPLAQGLQTSTEHGERILRRILYWTGGHPFLTQKLFQTIANRGDCDEQMIDTAVEAEFLSSQGSISDSNLNFVRDRIMKAGKRTPAILRLYRRIRIGHKVIDNTRSRIHSELKLSGLVVQCEDRCLRVRNLIYERVFSPQWIKEVMPASHLLTLTLAAAVLSVVITAGTYYIIIKDPKSCWSEIQYITVMDYPVWGDQIFRKTREPILPDHVLHRNDPIRYSCKLTVWKNPDEAGLQRIPPGVQLVRVQYPLLLENGELRWKEGWVLLSNEYGN